MSERVLILGASDKADRYSHMALMRLLAAGHEPVLVHPRLEKIEGLSVFRDLTPEPILADGPVDTVTLYVNAAIVGHSADAIIALGPRRVIMNPGTENHEARLKFEKAGILTVEACTLVLLGTGQF